MTARVLAGNPSIQLSVLEGSEPLPITSSPIHFNDEIATASTTAFRRLIRALSKMRSHHDDSEEDSFKPSVSDDLDSEVAE
ncbi:predicted protein [Histoplasma mississippiense (nom. inval.)]|uniref:predicted protein n=1 Tax=Ajellomyces capsulatus (strain NAm1 / WU24) TaxID=2059318 RepID=UPI000157D3CF|nr:predicted protein [Histoplasma mississippiense (nom. inval.)]EDN04814.1 predicted protein [Histoplasma mississippiense (nom. inval.)]